MPRRPRLSRKSYFVDPRVVRRARRLLGVRTESEAIRTSVEWITEMETFWRFMKASRGTLKRGSFERP